MGSHWAKSDQPSTSNKQQIAKQKAFLHYACLKFADGLPDINKTIISCFAVIALTSIHINLALSLCTSVITAIRSIKELHYGS